MDCHGFTSNSIMFYPNLRKSSYSLEEYNKTKKIYHEEVKPQLTLILENVSISLNSMLPDLDFNVSEDLGSPFPNANVGKYAWGAITRKGKNKHTDLQFYVALRFDYLRFGIYVKQDKQGQRTFNEIYQSISKNPDEFLRLLSELKESNILLTRRINNQDSGEPKPLDLNEKYGPAWTIENNTRFNVMSAIKVEDTLNQDVSTRIIECFEKIIPLYKFVLGIK